MRVKRKRENARADAPHAARRWARFAVALALALPLGCDATAGYCLDGDDVTVDRFVMCDKSCLKGNAKACARERDLEARLCHEKFSVYHCMRACKDGDALACGRAQAAMR